MTRMHTYPLLVIVAGLLSIAAGLLFSSSSSADKGLTKPHDSTGKQTQTKETGLTKLQDSTGKQTQAKEKGPQVYTLCDPNKDTTVDLTAATRPFNIRSPNFPKKYNNNLRCTLVLRSGFQSLVLTFKHRKFDLEQSGSCDDDSLCVHGAKFCGQWPAGNEFQYILPARGTFTILFKTDPSQTERDFDIMFSITRTKVGIEGGSSRNGRFRDRSRKVYCQLIIVTPNLAMTGREIFQPQGDGSSGDLLCYVRVVFPSVPSTTDNCEPIDFETLSGD